LKLRSFVKVECKWDGKADKECGSLVWLEEGAGCGREAEAFKKAMGGNLEYQNINRQAENILA
jgi:hypothetical protein